ncbi:MAG: TIGR02452 family protein [Coriobacteriaceae bacterium]|nr:TIGR02452 family protein [Coriobacteriaceae bacterium]
MARDDVRAEKHDDGREAQAKKHVAVMKAVFGTETRASIEGAAIVEAGYAPEAVVPEGADSTAVSFASGNAVTAVFHAEKPVAVLDPASYRYAGGGYLRGWRGPEEDLCDEGNLLAVLEAFQKTYYAPNKQTASGELYTSRAITIPDVVFSRNGEIVKASVAVVAAPNRMRAMERNRSERECDLALAERVDTAMRLLAGFGATTVVVPAFGFGRRGDFAARQVAELFHEWIAAHDGAIANVVFVLRRGDDADAFKAVFADRWHDDEPEPEPVVDAVEDDDEEEDWEKYRISGE